MNSPDVRRWSFRDVLRQVMEMDVVDLALRLTLVDLLLRPIGNWAIRPFILSLAAMGVILPGQLRKPGLWFVLTCLTSLRVVLDWPLPDNHAYLLCYWCFAVFLALVSQDAHTCLAFNGRLLIGWAFAFATLWKLVLSPDYLDGRFFRVTMLIDPRFEDFVQWAGGLTLDRLDALREFVSQHIDGQLFGPVETPREPARVVWLARALTLWTVSIEGVTALAFLWPVGQGVSRLRHLFLLSFCATTYAVATVEGFGWLLMAMGVAQCEPVRKRTRLFYLAIFGLVLFYREVPWANLLLESSLNGAGSMR